jgi:hypothetical protein
VQFELTNAIVLVQGAQEVVQILCAVHGSSLATDRLVVVAFLSCLIAEQKEPLLVLINQMTILATSS